MELSANQFSETREIHIFRMFASRQKILPEYYSLSSFFQNEEILISLAALDELNRIIHASIKNHLQSYTSTDNFPVIF